MSLRTPMLARRTFLRGAGALMGLPFLEAMTAGSAFASTAGAVPLRSAFVFIPNGVIGSEWFPKQTGDTFDLPPSLKPFEKIRSKLLVLSKLMQDNARPKGDGAGDHARSAAAFLTGAKPVKTAGADIRVGTSIDQIIAEKIGKETNLPSLEIGLEGGRNAGQCDSGYSCAYSNAVSWKSPTTPMAKETHPKLVFERLFGGSQADLKARAKRDSVRQSILDIVQDDAKRLQGKLGRTDRRKMDEYFSSVRELEQRIERSAQRTSLSAIPDLNVPANVPKELDEHMRLMYDLLILAFQTDSTRVATYMLANEGSNRSYPQAGVNDGHHHLSHHQNKQDWVDQLKKIDLYLTTGFAAFLERMDAVKEGDGSLLDHSMIVYGSAIGDGNRHTHHDLPILLAGGGNGTIKGGRHIEYPHETPLNNLFLSMLDRLGHPEERFGDSTGKLPSLDA